MIFNDFLLLSIRRYCDPFDDDYELQTPSSIDVYALSASDDQHGALLCRVLQLPMPSLGGPGDFRLESLSRRIAGGYGRLFAFTRIILHLWVGAIGQNICVPSSVFLPERPELHQGKEPDTVPWATWSAYAASAPYDPVWDRLELSGLHSIFNASVLDFNQYDAARDLYGPTDSGPHGDPMTTRSMPDGASLRCCVRYPFAMLISTKGRLQPHTPYTV